MKDFLKKVLNGNGFMPPDFCLDAFNKNFEGAVNIDWFDRNTHYEAIFYKNNIEHIAVFDKSGNLQEYKMYLPDNFLPESIKSVLEKRGEIMNTVFINKGNTIVYEVIMRDKELNRFLVLLSNLGEIIDEKPL